MDQLQDPKSGFHLPEVWLKDPQTMAEIEQKVKTVHQIAFQGKETLNASERQDFVEIPTSFNRLCGGQVRSQLFPSRVQGQHRPRRRG